MVFLNTVSRVEENDRHLQGVPDYLIRWLCYSPKVAEHLLPFPDFPESQEATQNIS